MKILVVCQYFYPEQFRINDICFELASMGHKVTVLTGLPNYPSGVIQNDYRWFRKRHEYINGVEVIRAPLFGRGKGILRLAINYISFAMAATLQALFIKKDFDIIWVYQLSPVTMALPAILLKKLTRKRILFYCNDLWPESISAVGISKNSLIYRLLLLVSRWIYKKADQIAISSRLFEKYFQEVIGIKNKLVYLPAYAEGLFKDVGHKIKNDNTINLLFAGNIGAMQSVDTIIKAANELKNYKSIKWHIVGDGSDREKCEKLATELGLDNIIFYGHRPLSEMPSFYSMADAFLITLKANEAISYTLPNKMQSYMAAGKPVIGAIDGETRMVIEESGCGLVCAAEDYKSLAEVVRQFAINKEKHAEYGRNARKYYDEYFNKDKFIQNLFKLLEETRDRG